MVQIESSRGSFASVQLSEKTRTQNRSLLACVCVCACVQMFVCRSITTVFLRSFIFSIALMCDDQLRANKGWEPWLTLSFWLPSPSHPRNCFPSVHVHVSVRWKHLHTHTKTRLLALEAELLCSSSGRLWVSGQFCLWSYFVVRSFFLVATRGSPEKSISPQGK